MRLLHKILVPPILITVVFVGILAYLYRTGEANIETMQGELDEFSATAKRVNQDGIKNLVHVIESVIEDPLLDLNVRTINSILKSLKKYPAVQSAFLVNADELILGDGAHSIDMAELGQPLPADAVFNVPLDHSAVRDLDDSFVYSHVFVSQGRKIGRLQLVFSVKDIDAMESALHARALAATEISRSKNIKLITIASLVIAIALGAALLSIRRVALRLNQLTEGARLVSAGDLEYKVPVTSRDELGALAKMFNKMTADLKRSFATISQRTAEAVAARDEALQANRAKSDFLANVSHELRTPLNAIIGYSEMLQEEAEELGHEHLVADLQKIHGAGRHLLGLINDILDLSKIEAGKVELFLEDFAVAALVAEVEATIRPLVAKNANSLDVDLAPDLGVMHSDQTKIRQSLFNLLSNATKFTTGGRISLAVRRATRDDRDWLEFEVSDTGIGIAAEHLGRLFQAFSQAEASTTRRYGGTGLGLAITRHFCRMLGGDVAVASEPGKGTTFTMTLPAAADRAAEEPPPAPPAAAGARGTVLAIDDERAVHEFLERELGAQGYRVVRAVGGRAGLRLAREVRPDAITLDIIMPEMDGWAVLRELKADPDLRGIPVLLVTVLGDREMGYTLGAADYLTKPVETDALLQALSRLLTNGRGTEALVVDDDPVTREMLRRTLARNGWTVAQAADGREALARLERATPAVVLLDLMMPGVDGFEVLEAMRRKEAWRDIPVVIITAKDLTREELARLNGCAERVFRKGAYDRAELVGIIDGVIARHAAPSERGTPGRGG